MRSAISCLLLLLTSIATWADDWPQWRGPKFDGHSSEKNLPDTLNAKRSIIVNKDVCFGLS